MAEWLIEQGIGEERALLIDSGLAIAARIHWPGGLTPGQVEDAILVSRAKGSLRGTARFANGEEALVDRLPKGAQEGAALRLEITRSAFSEKIRIKRAQARPTDLAPRPAPNLAEILRHENGQAARIVRHFPGDDWDEFWAKAWTGFSDFSGGSLHFSATPAMVLVDVDGALAPRELALAAAPALAQAIRQMDLAGSIGIDFPTLGPKADRRVLDDALDAALAGWPHERTAMNGFGFVQLVSRLKHPSMLHRITQSRTGAAARHLLRRAEKINDPGAILLTMHPAVKAGMKADWLSELARRTGREIRQASDPSLALDGGFAQAVQL